MRALPSLDVLLPAHGSGTIAPDPAEEALVRAFAYPPAADVGAPSDSGANPSPDSATDAAGASSGAGDRRWYVRANMVASVDGGAWGSDHRSGTINDAADWRVFRVLRALADVVVVGAGTARAESYPQLSTPKGLEYLRRAPIELALVSASGSVPAVLAAADRPPFMITGDAGAQAARAALPADRVIVVGPAGTGTRANAAATAPIPGGGLDLAAGLAALADCGLRNVLCEGGPTLLAALLAVDLVDELCLTTTPLLVGAGPGRVVGPANLAAPSIAGPSIAAPAAAGERPARLIQLLHAEGTLLARWSLRPAE